MREGRARAWWRAVGVLGTVVAAWAGPFVAALDNTCDDTVGGPYVRWSSPTGSTGAASAPANDTTFTTAGGRAYFVQGKKLLAFRNVADPGGAAGSKAWETCFPDCAVGGATLQNFPSPVPVSNPPLHGGTTEFLFVGAEDGWLYKVRADDGVQVAAADTRRHIGASLVCDTAPGDALDATPAVVLYNYASPAPGSRGEAFRNDIDAQGHGGDDVVIVFTADGCGDTTHNRIIAYWASNLAVKWIFNAAGDAKVDRGTEGCTLDYDNMRVFCGADLQDGAAGQDSLFALDILTGELLWSANAGAILNRPTLNFGTHRLYVANKAGTLMAYDPGGIATGGGQPLWPAALALASPGTVVSRSPFVESRGGPWQNKILALDSGGTLHAVDDLGTVGFLLWDLAPESGVRFRGLPVVLPGGAASFAFLGRDDGTLQMIELDPLAPVPRGAIDIEIGSTVYDPSIDLEGGSAVIVAVAGTTVDRLTIPLCLQPPF